MSRQALLEREQRWATPVAISALAGLALFIVSLILRGSAQLAIGGTLTETLRSIEANSAAYTAAGIVGALGLAALAPPLVYLFRAAQGRSERVQGAFVGFCLIGPVLVGVQSGVLAVAQAGVAKDFVEQAGGVGDIYTLASNLFDNSSAKDVALGVGSAGALSMVFAMIYTPLWAVRTGLLTRFTGTLGMALGASLIFQPLTGVAIPALTVWFAYLGMVLLGRGRGGRGPAWDAGEALPWPKPGEEPLAATAGANGAGGIVEGDATEIPGIDENPNAARRERAKRRKRKRRR